MSKPTIKNDLSCTFHADCTVSVYDCAAQQWVRTGSPSDTLLATLAPDERVLVRLHTGDDSADTINAALALPSVPWGKLDALGLDIYDVADEAERHGDSALARRARRYLARAA